MAISRFGITKVCPSETGNLSRIANASSLLTSFDSAGIEENTDISTIVDAAPDWSPWISNLLHLTRRPRLEEDRLEATVSTDGLRFQLSGSPQEREKDKPGVNPTVIATVDAERSNLVVWWTNIRAERTSSIARNCGAWTLRKADLDAIEAVIAGKCCLVTPTARKFLDSATNGNRSYLDSTATLVGVLNERDRLEAALREGRTGTSSKPLTLPTPPIAIDLVRTRVPDAPTTVQRALAISRGLVAISEYWESLEAARLSRPVLRKLGDGDLRELPLVLETQNSTRVETTRNRRGRTRKEPNALTLPFDEL